MKKNIFFKFIVVVFFVAAAHGCQKTEGKNTNEKLSIPSMGGGEINLSDHEGKVIILDFWATWCGPCRAEIPFFIDLYDEYKDDGLVIIGAAIDRKNKVERFYRQYKMNYPVGFAKPKDAAPFGGIRAFPTTFIIDREGKIAEKFVGYRPRKVFEEAFLELK